MVDAQEVLEVLFKVQSERLEWEPDDPQVSGCDYAWAWSAVDLACLCMLFFFHTYHCPVTHSYK